MRETISHAIQSRESWTESHEKEAVVDSPPSPLQSDAERRLWTEGARDLEGVGERALAIWRCSSFNISRGEKML